MDSPLADSEVHGENFRPPNWLDSERRRGEQFSSQTVRGNKRINERGLSVSPSFFSFGSLRICSRRRKNNGIFLGENIRLGATRFSDGDEGASEISVASASCLVGS